MEARFGYLRERDTSVDMLRVKLSRRRSRSQKENRDKALNIRRQLDKVPELECSQQDMSVVGNVSIKEKKSSVKQAKDAAVEERRKKLAHYKEKKELVKEKERREKEKKGVFKVGLYRAQPLASLPQVPAAATKARATTAGHHQSTRVTRSTVRQQAPKVQQPISSVPVSRKDPVLVEPPAVRSTRKTRNAIVEPLVSAPSTRSANRPLASVIPVVRNRDARTTSNPKQTAAPPAGRGRNTRGNMESNNLSAAQVEKAKKETKAASPPLRIAKKVDKMEDLAQATPPVPPAIIPSSFAPQDFVFQAPAGLSSFKPTPLTPRSADSFFKPSFVLPPVPLWPTDDIVDKMELSASSVKSVVHSPPRCHSLAPLCPPSPQEPANDLPYFRSVVVSEMEKLTGFCQLWELRVDDSSIPEEMRDRMRTAVGQARLLMKERFGQFTGLMDDCELGRGEKIITCTDLQGFWDMVYYQVEDVNKKFGALKEAESKGWQEESGPLLRPRKVVKKPPGAPVPKPAGGAAAKSRLAAIKAAVKAKRQAADAERASRAAGPDVAVEEPGSGPLTGSQAPEPPVVFHGGFFRVESPAKQTGSVKRPSCVTATPTLASPCFVPKFFTPRMTRLSNAACSSPLNLTPACSNLSLTHSSPVQNNLARVSPVKHISEDTQSEEGPSNQPERVSGQNDQPEQDGMQEDVVCDQSPLVTEPAVCPEESTESCDSEKICQSTSNTQWLTYKHQEAIGQSVATDELLAIHDVCSPVAVQPDPPSPSLQDREQAYHTNLPTSVSSNQSTSASKDPLSPLCSGTFTGPESPPVRCHAFSFTLSPTPVRARPTVASPLLPAPGLVPSPPPGVQVSLSDSPGAGVQATMTPDTSITGGLPGLDFERYLQPTARSSLSPQELGVAKEMLSPPVVDVEMESPVSSSGGPPRHNVSSPTAVSNLAQMFPARPTKPLESDLLLFTPDPMDRIRQSVCPSDLMSFTPPFNGE